MLRVITERLRQGRRTIAYPKAAPVLPERFRGRPVIDPAACKPGCACEADLNVLSTVVFDIGRFGIEFVASPRHADGLVVTGPVSRNMLSALLATHEATPDPKIVVACGACAVSGGLYAGFDETSDGAAALLPVDLFIPGCPPHPATILDGLMRLLGLPTPD